MLNHTGGEQNGLLDKGRTGTGAASSEETFAGKESQNGRSYPETQSGFLRRMQSIQNEGSGKERLYVKHGNSILAYTEKLRDTAHQLNGVDRLSKSIGLETASLVSSIPTSTENVKGTINGI